MSKVAIVTDSTVGIPKELADSLNISIAPQVLIWGQEMFRDLIDIQPEEYYKRLAKASIMPSTSQVTPASFLEVFKKLQEEGYEILAVLISEKLSGTIASAVQVKDMLPGLKIDIVDSESTSMAMGFPVIMAARAAASGASLAECKKIAQEAVKHSGLYLTVDTLEFLYRGGRIGGGTRFLGTALNIKPVLELRDGRIEGIERVRTRTKALNRVVELVGKGIAGRSPVYLGCLHANSYEDGVYLLEQAKTCFNPVETVISEVSPVIGTHAGPGTVGLAYMAGFSL